MDNQIIRVERFVDHTGSVCIDGKIIAVPHEYIGRCVSVYLPGGRIAPVAGTSLPKKRRHFLLVCFLTGQSPECFPEGATPQDVIARWRQEYEAYRNSAEKEVIEISGEFAADPANWKRVRGKGTPSHQAGCGGSV